LTLDSAAKAKFADVSRSAQAQLDLAETLGSARSSFE
jgi:hypothetical protein